MLGCGGSCMARPAGHIKRGGVQGPFRPAVAPLSSPRLLGGHYLSIQRFCNVGLRLTVTHRAL